jgi:UDP-N-acetylmuramoyl-L-alanyl-D-glutamate--2,6-diaminopimelate ligase
MTAASDAMPGARLSALVARLGLSGLLIGDPLPAQGSTDPTVGAIRYDSRRVVEGDVFVARRGQHADGHEHLAAAAEAGASAVIVERPRPDLPVPQVVVSDARAALATAAAWRAGDPSQRLGVVGITGTDGKTTTAYLVRAILEAAGMHSGLVGTTDVIVGGRSLGNAARTSTPEAPELQAHLAAMVAAGDTWVVLESTSHGLAQQRVGAVAYDVAVLTNITSEHLEFHGSLEAYREAKQGLFRLLGGGPGNPDKGVGKHAVLNADDPQSSICGAIAVAAGATVLRYALHDEVALAAARAAGARPPTADVRAVAIRETPTASHVEVATADWAGSLELHLPGRFNVANALAALGVAAAIDLDLPAAAAALSGVQGVPGRMQRIDEGQPFGVVVDYAHTAEALAKVLDELASASPAGLVAVFGSAGERDTVKRAAMGRVAGERCRLVIVTDEDPRGEDRLAILEAVAAGAEAAGRRRGEDLLLIADRATAIATAMHLARPGETVLLAGKGHERSIEMAHGDIPWDEAAAARDALRARGRRP